MEVCLSRLVTADTVIRDLGSFCTVALPAFSHDFVSWFNVTMDITTIVSAFKPTKIKVGQ